MLKSRNTAFWYNVACAVSTLIVLWYAKSYSLDWEFMGVYLGALGAGAMTSKHIAVKAQKKACEEQGD